MENAIANEAVLPIGRDDTRGLLVDIEVRTAHARDLAALLEEVARARGLAVRLVEAREECEARSVR